MKLSPRVWSKSVLLFRITNNFQINSIYDMIVFRAVFDNLRAPKYSLDFRFTAISNENILYDRIETSFGNLKRASMATPIVGSDSLLRGLRTGLTF